MTIGRCDARSSTKMHIQRLHIHINIERLEEEEKIYEYIRCTAQNLLPMKPFFFFCKFIFNSLFLFSKSIEMRAKSVQNNNNKRVFIANSNQYFRYCRSSLSLSPFASQINQLNIMSKGKTQKYRKHALASKSRSERFLNWRMKKLAWLKMKTRRSESWID